MISFFMADGFADINLSIFFIRLKQTGGKERSVNCRESPPTINFKSHENNANGSGGRFLTSLRFVRNDMVISVLGGRRRKALGLPPSSP